MYISNPIDSSQNRSMKCLKVVSIVALAVSVASLAVALTVVTVVAPSTSCGADCKQAALTVSIVFVCFALISVLAFVISRCELCSRNKVGTVYLKEIDGEAAYEQAVRDRFLERIVASTGDSRNADPRRAMAFLREQAKKEEQRQEELTKDAAKRSVQGKLSDAAAAWRKDSSPEVVAHLLSSECYSASGDDMVMRISKHAFFQPSFVDLSSEEGLEMPVLASQEDGDFENVRFPKVD